MPSSRKPNAPAERAPAVERRRARSDDALVALSYLLDAARRSGGLDALVLADDMGLAIAGAGFAADVDELAARAPELAKSAPANDTVPCRLDVMTRATGIRRLRIDGIEVLLCAEGEHSAADPRLGEAAAGCERILRTRR